MGKEGLVNRLTLALLACTVCISGCREERPVARDIDVREMSTEEAQRAAASHELLAQMRMFDVPDRVIYDAPASLARPAGATEWPPPAPSAGARPAPAQRDTSAAGSTTARDTTRRD